MEAVSSGAATQGLLVESPVEAMLAALPPADAPASVVVDSTEVEGFTAVVEATEAEAIANLQAWLLPACLQFSKKL
jgi:hypothetical protein